MEEWVATHELFVGNTHFQGPSQSRWTHQSSSGRKRVTDYLLFSKRLWAHVSDAEATSALDLGSDHRAVHAVLSLTTKPKCRAKRRKVRGWAPRSRAEYDRLLAGSLVEAGRPEQINIEMSSEVVGSSINQRCEQIETIVQEVAEKCQYLDPKQAAPQGPSKDKLKQLISMRRECRQRGDNVMHIGKQILREQRAISRSVRRAEVQRILEKFQGLNSIMRAGKLKGRDCISSMLDAHGKVQTDKSSIAEVFATFYEELYSSRDELRDAVDGYRPSPSGTMPFTMHELVGELRSLKGGKCPDGAGIVAEMLKDAGLELRTCFLNLFNAILCSQALPPQRWRHSTISVIFKSGDPQVAKNYRPISILSMTYKLFSRLLLRRVRPILEQAQAVDQAGFRAGFSCSDHLFCLAQIQEKAY